MSLSPVLMVRTAFHENEGDEEGGEDDRASEVVPGGYAPGDGRVKLRHERG